MVVDCAFSISRVQSKFIILVKNTFSLSTYPTPDSEVECRIKLIATDLVSATTMCVLIPEPLNLKRCIPGDYISQH
jgi:hypothetical protein